MRRILVAACLCFNQQPEFADNAADAPYGKTPPQKTLMGALTGTGAGRGSECDGYAKAAHTMTSEGTQP